MADVVERTIEQSVPGTRLAAELRAFDRSLRALEDAAIRRLRLGMQRSADELRRELRKLYEQARQEIARDEANRTLGRLESIEWRTARAKILLAQLEAGLNVINARDGREILQETVLAAAQRGIESALRQVSQHQRETLSATAVVPFDVAAVATQALRRLDHHGRAFAQKAERLVVDGLIRGRSWGAVSRDMQRELNITAYQAERIVRTESISAQHQARIATYQAEGIEIAVWVATLDDRVCGFCAARAGLGFALKDVIIPAHPQCRCTVVPVRREWIEEGLVDTEWMEEHRREAQEAVTHEHLRPDLSPGEKYVGRTEAPQPVWVPGSRPLDVPPATGGGESGPALAPPVSSAGSDSGGSAPTMSGDMRPWEPEVMELDPEALAGLSEVYRDMIEEINPEALRAFEEYTGHAFSDINEKLRSGIPLTAEEQAWVRAMDEIFSIDEFRLGQDMQLFRGMMLDASELPDDLEKLVGTVMENAGYSSTSYRMEGPLVTLSQLEQQMGEDMRDSGASPVYVMLRIQAREGDVALPVEAFSSNPQDYEVLYNRGSAFEVLGVRSVTAGELAAGNADLLSAIDPGLRVIEITVQSAGRSTLAEAAAAIADVVSATAEVVSATVEAVSAAVDPDPRTMVADVVRQLQPQLDPDQKMARTYVRHQMLSQNTQEAVRRAGLPYRLEDFEKGGRFAEASAEELRRISEEIAALSRHPSYPEVVERFQEFRNAAQELVNQSELAVRAGPQAAVSILEDGQFLSQFATGRSGGLLDTDFRAGVEKDLFGYAEDLWPMDRPIYGYMVGDDPSVEFFTDHYGGIKFILKDEVRPRTTFTPGDSLDTLQEARYFWGMPETVPSPLNDLDWRSFVNKLRSWTENNEPHFRDDEDLLPIPLPENWAQLLRDSGFYGEIQVHGQLKVEEVDRIIITKEMVEEAKQNNRKRILVEDLKRLAAELGIPLEVEE